MELISIISWLAIAWIPTIYSNFSTDAKKEKQVYGHSAKKAVSEEDENVDVKVKSELSVIVLSAITAAAETHNSEHIIAKSEDAAVKVEIGPLSAADPAAGAEALEIERVFEVPSLLSVEVLSDEAIEQVERGVPVKQFNSIVYGKTVLPYDISKTAIKEAPFSARVKHVFPATKSDIGKRELKARKSEAVLKEEKEEASITAALVAEKRKVPDVKSNIYAVEEESKETDSANTADEKSAMTADNTTELYNSDLGTIEVAILSSIFILATLGNSIVLTLILTSRHKLSRMTTMIVHLCSADLFVAFFNVLPQLLWDATKVWTRSGVDFYGNDFLCKLVAYLQVVAMFASSYVLVATAIDRYLAICCPLSSHTWTRRKTRLLVTSAWLLSLALSLPQIQIWSQRTHPKTLRSDCCATFYPDWTQTLYITWITIAIFLLPAVILCAAYTRICHTVWMSIKDKERSGPGKSLSSETGEMGGARYRTCSSFRQSARTMPTTVTTLEENHRASSEKHKRRNSSLDSYRSVNSFVGSRTSAIGGGPRARRLSSKCFTSRSHMRVLTKAKIRTVKLTVAVNASYLFCWAPYFISLLWSTYDVSAPYDGPEMTITMLLASLNSCTNPWIYLSFISNLPLPPWTTFFCRRCTSFFSRSCNRCRVGTSRQNCHNSSQMTGMPGTSEKRFRKGDSGDKDSVPMKAIEIEPSSANRVYCDLQSQIEIDRAQE